MGLALMQSFLAVMKSIGRSMSHRLRAAEILMKRQVSR